MQAAHRAISNKCAKRPQYCSVVDKRQRYGEGFMLIRFNWKFNMPKCTATVTKITDFEAASNVLSTEEDPGVPDSTDHTSTLGLKYRLALGQLE